MAWCTLPLCREVRELQISRLFSRGFVQAAMLLSALSLPATGQSKHGAGSNPQHGLAQAVERVLREGKNANLPPHLATLLGLSQESEFPVSQGVLRTGKTVQGFDVSIADHNDIVLFVVDETANNQSLYLTSTQGRLRKMVSVTNGVGRVAKITDDDKRSFEREKEFWLARLAPPRAPK